MDLKLARDTDRGRRAFTIIELLVVIAIIAVLAGLFFGVAGRVRESSYISRAESELAMLSQYLEQYKAHYGDYPRVTRAESTTPPSNTITKLAGQNGTVALYNALNGMRGVRPNATVTNPNDRERAFIDRSKFDHAFTDSPGNPSNPETDSVVLIDPWGNAYRYFYMGGESGSSWENSSYVLYSVGPDGAHQEPTNKGYPTEHDRNDDNIYAN